MASPGTPKTMSSRLLTMKFMQRAAASTPSSAPSTPTPPPSDQSSKRRKVSHNDTPSKSVDSIVNQAAIRKAIADEEKKVERAKLKRAEELGDAHWVLEVPPQTRILAPRPPLNVVQVGFAQIDSSAATGDDSDSDGISHDSVPALRRYNMDKKMKTKQSTKNDSDSDSDSGSDSDSDSDSGNSSSQETSGRQSFGSNSQPSSTTQSPARKVPKRKKSLEQLKAKEFAEKRRKKEIKLSKQIGAISSISSGGGPSPRQTVNFTCFKCGQAGHKALDCKQNGNRQKR
ncbi:hypothetical protein F4808DRAFT_158858 [Astrocystis sublimbata]|nr:hypothetical protein F4808DRAFT_158858 [Astrocystis sublimbata]